jgi:hypothetical protein
MLRMRNWLIGVTHVYVRGKLIVQGRMQHDASL